MCRWQLVNVEPYILRPVSTKQGPTMMLELEINYYEKNIPTKRTLWDLHLIRFILCFSIGSINMTRSTPTFDFVLAHVYRGRWRGCSKKCEKLVYCPNASFTWGLKKNDHRGCTAEVFVTPHSVRLWLIGDQFSIPSILFTSNSSKVILE